MDDADYLKRVQYSDSNKLAARMALHREFSTNQGGWHPWLFDQVALQPGERLLEVGCGNGLLWAINKERIPDDVELVLTDFSEGMLADAEAMLAKAGVAATFTVMDVQALDFADASFDVVLGAHMLYHVPDRPLAIRELRRVLRPAGRAVLATNGQHHLLELDALMERYAGGSPRDDLNFSLEDGGPQLTAAFSEVVRTEYEDSLRVTDGLALARYILSMPQADGMTSEAVARMSRELEALVVERGAYEIRKSSGAFTCR